MAQVVGYMENDVEFEEGPFVIVYAGGWRIEAEMKGHHCPVLPDLSIYPLKAAFGMEGKTNDRDLAAFVCDRLNQMVRDGRIVLKGTVWVKGYCCPEVVHAV